MKEMLRELQYHVIGIASDYEEAGKILSSCVPDIALLDIHLQEMRMELPLPLPFGKDSIFLWFSYPPILTGKL